jgi:hypothetical protein
MLVNVWCGQPKPVVVVYTKKHRTTSAISGPLDTVAILGVDWLFYIHPHFEFCTYFSQLIAEDKTLLTRFPIQLAIINTEWLYGYELSISHYRLLAFFAVCRLIGLAGLEPAIGCGDQTAIRGPRSRMGVIQRFAMRSCATSTQARPPSLRGVTGALIEHAADVRCRRYPCPSRCPVTLEHGPLRNAQGGRTSDRPRAADQRCNRPPNHD